MHIFALVDYDNVRPNKKEKISLDVEENLIRIANRSSEVARSYYPGTSDLFLRLYGGWRDKSSQRTTSGAWIETAASKIRRRLNGIRVLPEIVTTNFECDLPAYKGLYRDGGQKMVDTLIVADLITIVNKFDCPVLMLSDDEDMLPGIVAVRNACRKVTVLRNRQLGEAMNDHIFNGIQIQVCGGVE
jgi:uncharacterized LabA/DUF88 family protein